VGWALPGYSGQEEKKPGKEKRGPGQEEERAHRKRVGFSFPVFIFLFSF
jgi:hypothetical protein